MAENIGMCARAMANFGLSDLRLVAPRDGWPQKTRMKKGAYQASAGAHDLLEAAQLFDTVAEAVADLGFVWATTARERGQGKPVVAPAQAMARAAGDMANAKPVRHGILFGAERTGLDNEELAIATAIITFPVNPQFSSLNLSQAVLLMGYEWFRARHGEALPFSRPNLSPPVPQAMLQSFFDDLETRLDAADYFIPDGKKPIMWRNLRNILQRLEPSEQDIRSLRGMVVALSEGRMRRSGKKE